jgi:hypothetical protein
VGEDKKEVLGRLGEVCFDIFRKIEEIVAESSAADGSANVVKSRRRTKVRAAEADTRI